MGGGYVKGHPQRREVKEAVFSGFRATFLRVLEQGKLLELGKASALIPDPDLSLQRRKLDSCQAGQTDMSTGMPWAPSESELSLIPHIHNPLLSLQGGRWVQGLEK